MHWKSDDPAQTGLYHDLIPFDVIKLLDRPKRSYKIPKFQNHNFRFTACLTPERGYTDVEKEGRATNFMSLGTDWLNDLLSLIKQGLCDRSKSVISKELAWQNLVSLLDGGYIFRTTLPFNWSKRLPDTGSGIMSSAFAPLVSSARPPVGLSPSSSHTTKFYSRLFSTHHGLYLMFIQPTIFDVYLARGYDIYFVVRKKIITTNNIYLTPLTISYEVF